MKNDTQAYPIKVVDCIFATDQRGYKYISKATKLFVKCDAAGISNTDTRRHFANVRRKIGPLTLLGIECPFNFVRMHWYTREATKKDNSNNKKCSLRVLYSRESYLRLMNCFWNEWTTNLTRARAVILVDELRLREDLFLV